MALCLAVSKANILRSLGFMAKEKGQRFTTPRAEIIYVFMTGLGKQDKKQREQNLPGKFQAVLRIKSDHPELAELEAEVNAYFDEHKSKGIKKCKSTGIKPEYKKDENGEYTKELTGYTLINVWTGSVIKKRDGKGGFTEENAVIEIYNSKGKKASLDGKLIGNGTIGRILGNMKTYEAKDTGEEGMVLYLNSLQIKTLVEYIPENAPDAEEDSDDDDWDSDDFSGTTTEGAGDDSAVPDDDDIPF